jgi:hypothetical protein
MIIQELLEVDCEIGEIVIHVYDKNFYNIANYIIGKNPIPEKKLVFEYESKIGDVYRGIRDRKNEKILHIKKAIHCWNLGKEEREKVDVGAVLQNIPRRILGLEICNIMPYRAERLGMLHGYCINCICPNWMGLPGENEVAE